MAYLELHVKYEQVAQTVTDIFIVLFKVNIMLYIRFTFDWPFREREKKEEMQGGPPDEHPVYCPIDWAA